MEQITISKFTFDTLVENIEDLKKVLNQVNYDKDHSDPRNIESCPAYVVGYSKSTITLCPLCLRVSIHKDDLCER